MKNKFLTTALVATLCLSVACAKKTATPNINAGNELSNLPTWVIDPSVKDGVGGVGIASPSKGGIQFQIPKAELDAKANIAATIQSEISRITKNSLRSAQVNGNDDVEEFFAQATKDVVKNLPLSGVKRVNMYKGTDGSLYIQMVLKNEDYSKFLESSEKTFAARAAKSALGRENINKTQAATKELFDELEKERDAKVKAESAN
ncbi:MAG: hypothetical protein KA100_02415 [Rickettsiales bacterium]|nr:hypothetical protein [Rickettsiales bacterium]